MSDEENRKSESDEMPVDAHKNFFAKDLGIRRRGRPTTIDEEKNSSTECRLRLNLRQERIVKSINKELGLSNTAIVRRFLDEGIKRWANQGRDKFDLSYKVKKVYEETVTDSISPIATQVVLMNQKMDAISEELAHLAIELSAQDETANKAASPQSEEQNQTALRLLLTMHREVLSQNELLVEMIGKILKWTPAFQTGSGTDARADEDKYNDYLIDARNRTKKVAEREVRKIVQEDKTTHLQ